MVHESAFLGQKTILLLLVSSLRPSAEHQAGEIFERLRHGVTEIGSDDIERKPETVESITEQPRPVDLTMLDE
jgi:hypothetical protein